MTTTTTNSKGSQDGELVKVESPASSRDKVAVEAGIPTGSSSYQGSSSYELLLVTDDSPASRTRQETDAEVTIGSNPGVAPASLAQRLGGGTPTQTSTDDVEQPYLVTPATFEAVTGSLTQHIAATTQAAEDTARQVQHLHGPMNSPPQARQASIDKIVQPLDAVDLDSNEFDTFVAIPYEQRISIEKLAEQLPRKLSTATRPFILRRSTEAQKRAALAQTPEVNGFADRYDYLKRYPKDPPEEAMGPNARAWRVYLDEAEQFDIDMVDGFKETVDVMLVFAGLFSAVVTTFVVQASTALRLDYSQVIASVLIEQLHIQRAIASDLPTPDPLPTTLSLHSTTTTGLDRLASGLWFVSLSFSLATALFAVLVKQWIQSYVSPVSGSPQTRVRVRQYRFMGLEKWHVPLIVGLLPTLLHLSLLLFFLGLVVFLFALDSAIAGVIVSITTTVYMIYVVTNLAPLFNTQCPYKTPLSVYALLLLHPYIPGICALSQSIICWFRAASLPARFAIQHASQAWKTLKARLHPSMTKLGQFRSTTISCITRMYGRRSHHLSRPSSYSVQPKQGTRTSGSMKACELEDIVALGDVTDAKALCWVVTWSSNPSVKAVMVETVCDLPLGFRSKHILRNEGMGSVACASLEASTTWDGEWRHVRPGLENTHFKSSLVHFQLGWCYFPTLDGMHIAKGTARHERCIYDPNYPDGESHQDVGGRLGPYFSLLLEPSWEVVNPQHILQTLPPKSPQIVFLLSLRRAALHLRADPSSRTQDDMVDWTSCQELFTLVQLEPPPADLFGLWQTTLVSIYLASLVPRVAPISEDSELLRSLLFNHIELGSSELSVDLAINLSRQSCMEFLAHTLGDQAASINFSSSDRSSQLIGQLGGHFMDNRLWVSDPDKIVVGLHHRMLVALLDHSENHSAWISAELRTLLYSLGRNMMERNEPQSSDPELDLVASNGRLLRATLIQPQLSEPYALLESQILCLYSVLCNSPPAGLSVLVDIFRDYDGISVLEKIIVSAGSQLHWHFGMRIVFSLELYLKQVYSAAKNSLPSPGNDLTQHGGHSDANGQDHLGYILRHLVQVIRTCVACHPLKISRLETHRYPDTLHILRRIVRTRHELLPECNHALTELESQGSALPALWWTPDDVEHNVQEIISILRADLQAARSLGAQPSRQSERPLPPLPSISIPEAAGINTLSALEATIAEESCHPISRDESIVLRSTHRFRTAVWGVIAARRLAAGAILPLHNRTLTYVQEYCPGHNAERESLLPDCDEEEGLSADASSTTPT